MEQLIDDLLTLAREGETESDPEPANLRAVARRCRQTVESTGLQLSVMTDLTIAASDS